MGRSTGKLSKHSWINKEEPDMKFGVIGNDQMLLSCLRILLDRPDAEISFVIYDTRRINPMNPIGDFCEKHKLNHKGIERLNEPEMLHFIQQQQPDYILSINNFWVIRPDVLAVPARGTINFHNSVPSRYHGLNVPSWVIMNGEKTHGAMWHFVEPAIDTGEVLLFREFELAKGETAASLMVKCIRAGIELFPELLDQLYTGNIQRIPQQPNASYFGKKQYPANNGYIDFSANSEVIERLVRGLNYLPYANHFLYAKIRHGDKELIVNEVGLETPVTGAMPGVVLAVEEDRILVGTGNGVIAIEDAMDEEGNECNGEAMAGYFGICPGDKL